MSTQRVKMYKRESGGLMLYSQDSMSQLRFGSVSNQSWIADNRKPWLVVLMYRNCGGDGNHYGNREFRKRRQAKKFLQKWGSR